MSEERKVVEVKINLSVSFVLFWLGLVLAFAIGFSLGSLIEMFKGAASYWLAVPC